MHKSKNRSNEIDLNKIFGDIKENKWNIDLLQIMLKKLKIELFDYYKNSDDINENIINEIFYKIQVIISYNNKEYNFFIIEFILNILINITNLDNNVYKNVFYIIIIVF